MRLFDKIRDFIDIKKKQTPVYSTQEAIQKIQETKDMLFKEIKKVLTCFRYKKYNLEYLKKNNPFFIFFGKLQLSFHIISINFLLIKCFRRTAILLNHQKDSILI